jgi:hypothetical protein
MHKFINMNNIYLLMYAYFLYYKYSHTQSTIPIRTKAVKNQVLLYQKNKKAGVTNQACS